MSEEERAFNITFPMDVWIEWEKELQALRDWKEKARPFIERDCDITREIISGLRLICPSKPVPEKTIERLKILTELIKGEK